MTIGCAFCTTDDPNIACDCPCHEDPWGDDNDPLSVMPQGVAAEALRNPYYLY